MEIHVPRKAITSLKDLSRELAIITAGILIALSLEGLLQWKHHRDLAREARANIMSELRENQVELAKEIEQLEKIDQQGQALVALVHQLQSNRKAPIHEASYSFSVAQLHSTSSKPSGTQKRSCCGQTSTAGQSCRSSCRRRMSRRW